MAQRIHELTDGTAAATGDEMEVVRLSATATMTRTDISAAASDNSFNTVAGDFTASFAEGKSVQVSGFTGSGSNNVHSRRILTLTANKMTVDGDPLVDDAAGESVTISQWVTRRVPTPDAADVSITDAGNYYTGSDVEAALQEIPAKISAAVAGLSWKQAVRAATTAAGTLATSFENGDAIDGVTLATGDRILIKNQGTASENGIYVVAASGAPARASDADSGAELVNASVYVSEGTTLADTQWTCSTNAPITVGSTSLTFAQLTSGGMTNPMTTAGDIITGGSGGTPQRLAAGTDGYVLTMASGSPSWAAASGGGLTNWTDGVNTSSPNATIPVVSLTATNAATNVDAAILVKGTGAILAQIPDGTTTGGNKRGNNAVDLTLSTVRTSAADVASGSNAFQVGANCRASGSDSVAIGLGSRATNGRALAMAGGTASGDSSVCIGNYNSGGNTASGAGSVVIGGQGATATNTRAISLAGAATGVDSLAAIGGTASGTYSCAIGDRNSASGQASVAIGQQGDTRSIFGALAHGTQVSAAGGDAQYMRVVLAGDTTNATEKELTAGQLSVGSTSVLVLPDNSAYACTGTVVGRQNSTGDTIAWTFSALIRRGSGAGTTAMVAAASITQMAADSGASTWALAIGANTTQGALYIRVTGEASKNIKWRAFVESAQTVG